MQKMGLYVLQTNQGASCNKDLYISGGSGLPEPENPTGFGPILQTRTYPNPKISGIPLPEITRTRIN